MKLPSISTLRLFVALHFVFLVSCGASNVREEQTQFELRKLQEKIDETQALSKVLLEHIAMMDVKHDAIEPRLVAMQTELRTIKYRQKQRDKLLPDEAAELETIAESKPTEPSGKLTLGRVEWLWLVDVDRYFSAQLDTGLELSIVYAEDIMPFERDGDKWLSFTLERNDWPTEFAAKIDRNEKVQSVRGGTQRGYVVSLPIQLAEFNDELDFIVLEKKKSYPQVVLGKNFLTDVAMVDVSEKYLHKKNPEAVRKESDRKKQFEAGTKPISEKSKAAEGELGINSDS